MILYNGGGDRPLGEKFLFSDFLWRDRWSQKL